MLEPKWEYNGPHEQTELVLRARTDLKFRHIVNELRGELPIDPNIWTSWQTSQALALRSLLQAALEDEL